MTLSKRIVGILRQYPNPEVAFFTADILLGSNSYYLGAPLKVPGGERIFPDTVDPHGTIWETGRQRLHLDQQELGSTLRACIETALANNKWYTDKKLDVVFRTEHLAPWVAKLVNAWLKSYPAPEVATYSEVVEHYKKLKQLGKSSNDIADWSLATHPDIMKFTLGQALHRARRWHAAERRTTAAAEAPPSRMLAQYGPEEDPTKWSIFALETKEALEHEGTTQHHCVGRYWTDVVEGRTKIFSVRDKKGVSHATFEMRGGHVVQRKGPANREITKPGLNEAINDFAAENKDALEDDERDDELIENPLYDYRLTEAEAKKKVGKMPIDAELRAFERNGGVYTALSFIDGTTISYHRRRDGKVQESYMYPPKEWEEPREFLDMEPCRDL